MTIFTSSKGYLMIKNDPALGLSYLRLFLQIQNKLFLKKDAFYRAFTLNAVLLQRQYAIAVKGLTLIGLF